MNRPVPDGVDYTQAIRIIGLEVRYELMDYRQEIMMLTPPGGHYDIPNHHMDPNMGRARLTMTIHTSHGDFNGEIQLL